MDFEAGHDAEFLADGGNPEERVGQALVGDAVALGVMHQDLHVERLAAEILGDAQVPLHQRFVTPEHVEEAAGEQRHPVLVHGTAELVDLERWRRALDIVEHAGLLHHAEDGVDIGHVLVGVQHAAAADTDEQVLGHAWVPPFCTA